MTVAEPFRAVNHEHRSASVASQVILIGSIMFSSWLERCSIPRPPFPAPVSRARRRRENGQETLEAKELEAYRELEIRGQASRGNAKIAKDPGEHQPLHQRDRTRPARQYLVVLEILPATIQTRPTGTRFSPSPTPSLEYWTHQAMPVPSWALVPERALTFTSHVV